LEYLNNYSIAGIIIITMISSSFKFGRNHVSLLKRGYQSMPEVDSRLRLLKSTELSAKKKEEEDGVNKKFLLVGGLSASLGSSLLMHSYFDTLFTIDNLGISLFGIGVSAMVYGSNLHKSSPTGALSPKKGNFKFTLLNKSTSFSAEKRKLTELCNTTSGINPVKNSAWPINVEKWLENVEKEDIKKYESDLKERKDTLQQIIDTAEPHSIQEALTTLAPKAFVLKYSNESNNSQRHRDDPRTRAEKFGEETSMLLSLATKNDVVIINLESPGGEVSEFGLAASHMMRLKQAGIKTIVTVDKVAASGGFMMACCADEIVAAPFAFLGSIGVVAEVPNLNRLLKKNDVDYEMFTAGEFKRTISILGENTSAGKKKFLSDLTDIHIAFKDHVHDNRGGKLDVGQVATGETWLAVQCQKYGLVDRLATSWDVINEHAAEGKDVVLVTRNKPPLSPWRQFLERTEVLMEDFGSLLRSPVSALRAPTADPITTTNIIAMNDMSAARNARY